MTAIVFDSSVLIAISLSMYNNLSDIFLQDK